METQDQVMAARGERTNNNSAYEAIQAKIKAAAEARKNDSGDPFDKEGRDGDKEETAGELASTQATSAFQTTTANK